MIPVGDTVQRRTLAWMTWLLIAVNAWVFLVELLIGPVRCAALLHGYGIVPAQPTVTTYFTYMFLHIGLVHVVFNLWALWMFGDDVEARLGPVRFLVFYLLSGLVAAWMHVKTYEQSLVPVVGASGAIAGIMGAYCVLFPRARFHSLSKHSRSWPAFVYLGGWFALQVLYGWDADRRNVSGGVAWWVHVGGFMTGCLLVLVFVRRDHWSRRDPDDSD